MTEWVHRCMTYYNGRHYLSDQPESIFVGLVSEAYGRRPERKYIEAAINDMVVLKATSLKSNTERSPFFAAVVSYPKGGEPPTRIERRYYWACNGDEDS